MNETRDRGNLRRFAVFDVLLGKWRFDAGDARQPG